MATRIVRFSVAQQALSDLLKDDPKAIGRLEEAGIHRTQTHGYATGRRKPSADQAAKLEAATDGRVRAADWATTGTSEIEIHERVGESPEPEPGGAPPAAFRAGDPPTESGAPNAA
jgi:hypothetical protein